jgi:tRNA (cmo5U34)-methyltransferase
MTKYRFDPETYMDLMRAEVPLYATLQDTVAAATDGLEVRALLDLGSGTGETLRRVLDRHPEASAIGVDENDGMLDAARQRLDDRAVELRIADLLDPLPAGPFDLVVSALAVHHLDGPGKAELFRRIAAVLRPGGRFVLGDLVIPEGDARAVAPLTDDHDKPSTVGQQVQWLADAGLVAQVCWQGDDLAIFVADRPA